MRGDISEISICVSYLNYLVLYNVVLKMGIKGEIKSKFMGIIVPIMAMVGSGVILLGSITHEYFILFLVICYSVMGIGYYFGGKIKE